MDQPKQYEAFTIPLNQIYPDENQPRKQFPEDKIAALASSIAKEGLIEPIVVTPIGENKYKIISGERRLRAYKGLAKQNPDDPQWKEIKVAVIDNADSILSVIANIVKDELNPLEYASALQELKNRLGESTEDKQLAAMLEKSKSNISEWLSLNKLPQEIQDHAKKYNMLSFRILKKLATNKDKKNEQVLISEYNDLCEHRNAEDKSSKFEIITKRIKSIGNSMEKIDIESIDDNEDKQNLLDTIDKMLEQGIALKNKLLSKHND